MHENKSTSSIVEQITGKSIEIDTESKVCSVAFLAGGEHIVSGGYDGKIRSWQMKDGEEVGTPMYAGSSVWSTAVSQDGKWIVSGSRSGHVGLWNTKSREQETTSVKGLFKAVYAVDISPDATKIATGSDDETASVWSLPTGQRLLGPFEHGKELAAVKFSPDGRVLATATLGSVRIYDSLNGRLLVDTPIQVGSFNNQSLAWVSDSKQLFALSRDGDIHCLDASTGQTLSLWSIHSNSSPGCISLASNGTFIAASDHSSVSFWDTTTHKQIGSAIHHPTHVESMAMSANYDLVTSAGTKITLWNLRDIIPSPYSDDVSILA